jgi:predicted small lipoprotein YifL
MQTAKATFYLLICVCLLGACGLKGPLYLPDEPAATGPVTRQQEKDEDKEDESKKEKKQITVTSQ